MLKNVDMGGVGGGGSNLSDLQICALPCCTAVVLSCVKVCVSILFISLKQKNILRNFKKLWT